MPAQEQRPEGCHCKPRGDVTNSTSLPCTLLEGMVQIPAGTFLMGSEKFYREERPLRRSTVDEFWIDKYPVTNRQFQSFVEATGYITVSERTPSAEAYPDADPALLVPGSLVFTKPHARVALHDYRAWWAYVPGASWRHPEGPESSIAGREDHPVVQVCYEDACAYATWMGKSLPTESEWEFAARGGLDGATYPWGEEFAPGGRLMANIWIGRFPSESLKAPGDERTSSVGAFPPNGYGLYDVVGNVWEWTASPFDPPPAALDGGSCCLAKPDDIRNSRRVVKGGSHLCAPNYCLRYRPAARQGQTPDTATGHIGFRCVVRG